MRLVFCILLLCFWFDSAHAQQSMEDLCREIGQYVSIEDAKYEPDSDVPADLNAVKDPVFGSIGIPVEIDLSEYFDRPDLQMVRGLDLTPDVASIQVNEDGTIYYNGQEISDEIMRFCSSSISSENKEIVPKVVAPPKNIVKPQPKPQPKPAPKPQPKAKIEPPKLPKKSSVQVTNGDEKVIEDKSLAIKPEAVSKEPEVEDKNAIDVEALETQNNTDNFDKDTLIEGQYP